MSQLKSSRSGRNHRRPDLESLEHRQLLTLSAATPADSTAFVNGDGTVNTNAVTQASAARAEFNVDGSGGNVAVIDTGVDFNNAAFGSGAVGSATNKVVYGVDFTGSPNGVLPTWQHGTAVAGLIASDSGVAPGAGIVALRVFGDNNQGSFTTIEEALAWVAANHTKYDITAVNLSVSDNNNYQSNIFSGDLGVGERITQDVATLDSDNIPVVVAAGNNFDGKTQGMGFAAIIPDTISVTATDETKMTNGADVLATDAQRLGSTVGGASATDLAAPGVDINAPSGDSGTATYEGTSFATPQVTGTVLLLQQMYRQAYGTLPTVTQLDSWLTTGATSVHDNVTGISIGRLNVEGALTALSNQIAATAASSVAIAPPTTSAPTLTTQVISTPVVTPTTVSTTTATTTPTTTTATTPTATTTTATTPTSTSTTTSTSSSSSTVIANTPPLMTQVFVNGESVGSVATSALASGFGRLFALTGGSASTLRAWAPPGSVVDLGAVKPSGGTLHAMVVNPSSHHPQTATGHAVHSHHVIGRAVPRVGHPSLASRAKV